MWFARLVDINMFLIGLRYAFTPLPLTGTICYQVIVESGRVTTMVFKSG